MKCLALSASRRTLNTCLSILNSYAPRLVKSAIQSESPTQVFRDHLVTTVNFQSVLWDQYHHNRSDRLLYRQYLILGFLNGVIEVWLIESPQCQDTSDQGLPQMTIVLTLQSPSRLSPHISLIDDLDSTRNFPFRCRIAVCPLQSEELNHSTSEKRNRQNLLTETTSSSVCIYGSRIHDKNTKKNQDNDLDYSIKCSHILQQPYNIVGIHSSVCRSSDNISEYHGSLIVLTTSQIRAFDTRDFDLRFFINRFQTAVIPSFWQWVVSNHSNTVQSTCSERSIGPVAAVGTRWLVYQEAAHISKSTTDRNSSPSAVRTPIIEPISLASSLHGNNDHANIVEQKEKKNVRYTTDTAKSSDRSSSLKIPITNQAASSTKQLNTTLYKLAHVLPDAIKTASQYASQKRSSADELIIPRTHEGTLTLDGGSIVIVDILTGRIIGRVRISEDIQKPCQKTNLNSQTPSIGIQSNLKCFDVANGSWYMSHMENSDNKGLDSISSVTEPIEKAPLMSSMKFDSTGSTLYCVEYTGRTVYVCRFFSRGLGLQIDGHTVSILKRGETAGCIVDIITKPNTIGEGCTLVISSKGRCHHFSIPAELNLSILKLSYMQSLEIAERRYQTGWISVYYPSSLANYYKEKMHIIDCPPNNISNSRIFLSSKQTCLDGELIFDMTCNTPKADVSCLRYSLSPTSMPEFLCEWHAIFLSMPNAVEDPWTIMTVSSDGVIELWKAKSKFHANSLSWKNRTMLSDDYKNCFRRTTTSLDYASNKRDIRLRNRTFELVRKRVLSVRDLPEISLIHMNDKEVSNPRNLKYNYKYRNQRENMWSYFCEPWTCTTTCSMIDYTIHWIHSKKIQPYTVRVCTLQKINETITMKLNNMIRNGDQLYPREKLSMNYRNVHRNQKQLSSNPINTIESSSTYEWPMENYVQYRF